MRLVLLLIFIFLMTLNVFRIGYLRGQKDANEYWEHAVDKYYKEEFFKDTVNGGD